MNVNEFKNEAAQALRTGSSNGYIAMPRMMKDWFSKLSHTELGVLLAIYEYSNTVTGSCFASQQEIGEKLSIDRKATISDAIKSLISFNLIRVIPAKLQRDGKLVKTSNEIIIIPYDKVTDEAYIAEVDEMINTIKFVTVAYIEERGKVFRQIVGTGENTDCKTPAQMNAYTEERRQQSIKSSERVIDKPQLPSIEELVADLDDEAFPVSLDEDTKAEIISTVLDVTEELGNYRKGLFREIIARNITKPEWKGKKESIKDICMSYLSQGGKHNE